VKITVGEKQISQDVTEKLRNLKGKGLVLSKKLNTGLTKRFSLSILHLVPISNQPVRLSEPNLTDEKPP
jgi:hypothetical protein